MFFSAT